MDNTTSYGSRRSDLKRSVRTPSRFSSYQMGKRRHHDDEQNDKDEEYNNEEKRYNNGDDERNDEEENEHNNEYVNDDENSMSQDITLSSSTTTSSRVSFSQPLFHVSGQVETPEGICKVTNIHINNIGEYSYSLESDDGTMRIATPTNMSFATDVIPKVEVILSNRKASVLVKGDFNQIKNKIPDHLRNGLSKANSQSFGSYKGIILSRFLNNLETFISRSSEKGHLTNLGRIYLVMDILLLRDLHDKRQHLYTPEAAVYQHYGVTKMTASRLLKKYNESKNLSVKK
jgi:hypothetical protein